MRWFLFQNGQISRRVPWRGGCHLCSLLLEFRPGASCRADDPKNANSYYGPTFQLYDAEYLGEDPEKLAAKYGAGAKAIITLTPRTALIDGSKGAPVKITATLKEIGQTISHKTFDVPVALY